RHRLRRRRRALPDRVEAPSVEVVALALNVRRESAAPGRLLLPQPGEGRNPVPLMTVVPAKVLRPPNVATRSYFASAYRVRT
ncbi:MAG: hypothetical protein ABI877_20970, partial [Gemmatimonadaceae bacterium]